MKIFSNYSAWRVNTDSFYKIQEAKKKIEFLVRFAILAPSSHNTQPWAFKIRDNELDVFADKRRALVHGDPSGRLMNLALGCALENIKIAADHYQLLAEIFTKNVSTTAPSFMEYAATLRIKPATDKIYPESFFGALLKRCSYREKYTDKKIDEKIWTFIKKPATDDSTLVFFASSQKDKENLASFTAEGMKEKMSHAPFRNELASWLRINSTFQDDGMPGSGHGMSCVVSLLAPFILRIINVSNRERDKAYGRVLKFPAIAVIGSSSDNKTGWIKSGETLERLLVLLSAEGLAASLMASPIESLSARAKLKEYVQQKLGYTVFMPQMLIGFGYPMKKAPHSPRRNVKSFIL